MNGVYNRKLFIDTARPARQKLAKMGGIMASSSDLMQAAMPPVQPMAPAPMPMPQPMPQPVMMAPVMPAQPMPMAAPAPMPAQPMVQQTPPPHPVHCIHTCRSKNPCGLWFLTSDRSLPSPSSERRAWL